MLTMALTGAVIAALRATEGSAIAGLLTAYLVITALTLLALPMLLVLVVMLYWLWRVRSRPTAREIPRVSPHEAI